MGFIEENDNKRRNFFYRCATYYRTHGDKDWLNSKMK